MVRNCFTALCYGETDRNILSGVDLTTVGEFRSPLTLLYLMLQIRCRHPFLRLLEVSSISSYFIQMKLKFTLNEIMKISMFPEIF
jgi:hypothetical protein